MGVRFLPGSFGLFRMSIKILKVKGASETEVIGKKFNIFILISLGNKWFTKDHLKEYILWGLENTKENVVVVVADKLHRINFEVRNKYNPKRAMERAMKIGSEKINMLNKIISTFTKYQQDKISLLRWEEIETLRYEILKKIIYDEFNKNIEFKKYILDIVKNALVRWEDEKVGSEDLEKLSQYILDELPFLLGGVKYNNKIYNLHIYPYYTGINNLAVQMQNGKMFQELYKKFDRPKIVIVQLGVI